MLMTENAYSLSKAHILEDHNHPSIPKRYVESREIKDPFHFTCNSTGEQGDNADPRESFESILRPELSDDVCNEQNATLRADKHDDGRDYCDKSDNSGDAIGCMDKKPWPWRLRCRYRRRLWIAASRARSGMPGCWRAAPAGQTGGCA